MQIQYEPLQNSIYAIKRNTTQDLLMQPIFNLYIGLCVCAPFRLARASIYRYEKITYHQM
jgi:hypothetical protein